MEVFSDISVIVPIRKGSTRVKKKNLRPFFPLNMVEGESLLHWKLFQLSQVIPLENIIVSSDWDEALKVAESFGVSIDERPAHLAKSDSPFEEVISHCASLVSTVDMAWATVTSPFLGIPQINRILETYSKSSDSTKQNGVVAVRETRSYFFMGGSPLNFPTGKGHVQTQAIQPLSETGWTFNVRRTSSVVQNSYMFSDTPKLIAVDNLSSFDIDEELDFLMAQRLAAGYNIETGEFR